jgi:hypothetical protein
MSDDLVMPAGRDAAPAPSKPWREALADTVKPIWVIGPFLAAAIKQGSTGALLVLLWLVWTLFVYPLLLPALSAGWINAGVLRDARSAYTEPIRQAFGVKEFADGVALESNKRLDYVQVIEYNADARQPQTYLLSVTRNQRVVYRIEQAELYSEDKVRCQVPPELAVRNTKLFTLSVEETQVAEIRNGTHDPRSLTEEHWKAIVGRVGSDVDRLAVRIEPVPKLLNLECAKVKVRMRILFEVYKNLVGAPK